MKNIFLTAALLASVCSYAQNGNIALTNNQQLKIKTEVKQKLTLSMGMDVITEMDSRYAAKVVEANADNYKVEGTLEKLKVKSDAMGQGVNYDSDEPGSKDSQVGQVLSEMVGKKGVYSLKKSGDVDVISHPPVDSNKLAAAGMSGIDPSMIPGGETILKTAFLPSLAGHKAGDTWTDSTTTEEGLKNVSNYTLQSVSGNTANVLVKSIVSGKMQREAQGMTIDVDMTSNNDGTMEVDSKSFVVKKSNITSKVDSKMNVMGQEMTMTGTSEIKSEVE